MFLHIGGDMVVHQKDIVAIMDFESTTVSKITKEFLKTAQEEDFIVTVAEELPRAYVIAEINGHNKIYITPISPQTLQKRWENSFGE